MADFAAALPLPVPFAFAAFTDALAATFGGVAFAGARLAVVPESAVAAASEAASAAFTTVVGFAGFALRGPDASSGFSHFPVHDPFAFATSSGVPEATTMPPPSPPSGPRSTIQSAHFTTSRLCSMTTSVCPLSASRSRTPRSRSTSAKWRPVVGSSRM